MGKNVMKHIVIDNFFDKFNFIKDEFKKIPRYEKDDYNKMFPKEQQNWPGKRSAFILNTQPFLFNLFLKEFSKFNFDLSSHSVALHTHLRLEKDGIKDWIHRDITSDYSCIVYLSETNLNSGTYFYSENKEIVSDIKFVQNRAVLFDGRYLHSAYGHHGYTEDNGRLTLNSFIKKVKGSSFAF
jgi:hypothetical protein